MADVPADEDTPAEVPSAELVKAAQPAPSVPAITEAQLLARLGRYAEQARGAFSPNTERAVRADSAVFSAWCAAAGAMAFPAAPDTVARFVDAMAELRAPATVRRYVSSIAHLHRAAELPDPAAANAVRLALRRMGQAKGRAQHQAEGLTRRLVDRMLDAAGTTLGDLRDRALLAVAYDTLARRSELVALAVEDVRHDADGSGSLVIRRSKTDQEGEGMARYLAPDTVCMVQAWLGAAGIGEGAVFRAVRKGGRLGKPLHPNEVSVRFKAMAKRAGLPAEVVGRISAHSTRIGCAQDQAASPGISDTAIMQSGGWKSPQMVARYTRRQATKRSGAARLAEAQDRA